MTENNTKTIISVPQLNLPDCGLRIIQEGSGFYLFDVFRKKRVAFTPEEWVRQNFLLWLVGHLGYPKGLIAVEPSLKYNKLHKRADAVVFDKLGKPQMLIECKSARTEISQDTFSQAAGYNFIFGCKYLVLTNGLKHYCCKIDVDKGSYLFLEKIPVYTELS